MNVKELLTTLLAFAPLAYQESYDNSGLQVGEYSDEVKGVLLSLDVTESVLEEAIAKGCNVIVAHHPLIFSGIKNVTSANLVQRIIKKAILTGVNIIAIHTNLDNVQNGVNAKIAEKLGLINTRILSRKPNELVKLVVFVPQSHASIVQEALFGAGAGHIGQYSEFSFSSTGLGTFKGGADTHPFIGAAGGEREGVVESRLEVVVPKVLQPKVLQALMIAHPYEEVAYDLIPLMNDNLEVGAGVIGELEQPVEEHVFVQYLKTKMNAQVVRASPFLGRPISKVAVCGGSGSFLLKASIMSGADVLVTADFKYHQFFDADGKIVIMDIGHYETEQFTVEIFHDILNEKNINFAILVSEVDTNPIKYY